MRSQELPPTASTASAGWGMFTSNATSAYQSRTMATLSSFVIAWNETPGVPSWWIMPKIGVGITLTMAPNTRARSETVISIAHRKVPKWVKRVNQPLTKTKLNAVRLSAQRGRPLGAEAWVKSPARRFNSESIICLRGRQRVRPQVKEANKDA